LEISCLPPFLVIILQFVCDGGCRSPRRFLLALTFQQSNENAMAVAGAAIYASFGVSLNFQMKKEGRATKDGAEVQVNKT
jgi:hypothetical protein